ncbi:hypothetical protein LXJ58_30540, partial [Escherichia coli]|nr:hypothetical protein [Escherichia coli]
MSATADFSEDGSGTLRFSGDLLLRTIGDLPTRLDAISGAVSRIDLSGVDRIDTVGAWLIHRLSTRTHAAVEGLGEDGRHLFDQVAAADQPVALREGRRGVVGQLVGEV